MKSTIGWNSWKIHAKGKRALDRIFFKGGILMTVMTGDAISYEEIRQKEFIPE